MLTIKQHDKGKNKGLWEHLKHKHFWEKSWRWLGGGSTSKGSWRMSGISVQDGKARTFPAEWRGRETQKLKTLFSEPRWLQQNARGWKGGWGRIGGALNFELMSLNVILRAMESHGRLLKKMLHCASDYSSLSPSEAYRQKLNQWKDYWNSPDNKSQRTMVLKNERNTRKENQQN